MVAVAQEDRCSRKSSLLHSFRHRQRGPREARVARIGRAPTALSIGALSTIGSLARSLTFTVPVARFHCPQIRRPAVNMATLPPARTDVARLRSARTVHLQSRPSVASVSAIPPPTHVSEQCPRHHVAAASRNEAEVPVATVHESTHVQLFSTPDQRCACSSSET